MNRETVVENKEKIRRCNIGDTQYQVNVYTTTSAWQAFAIPHREQNIEAWLGTNKGHDSATAQLNAFINACADKNTHAAIQLCWDETFGCDIYGEQKKEEKFPIEEMLKELTELDSHTEESKLINHIHWACMGRYLLKSAVWIWKVELCGSVWYTRLVASSGKPSDAKNIYHFCVGEPGRSDSGYIERENTTWPPDLVIPGIEEWKHRARATAESAREPAPEELEVVTLSGPEFNINPEDVAIDLDPPLDDANELEENNTEQHLSSDAPGPAAGDSRVVVTPPPSTGQKQTLSPSVSTPPVLLPPIDGESIEKIQHSSGSTFELNIIPSFQGSPEFKVAVALKFQKKFYQVGDYLEIYKNSSEKELLSRVVITGITYRSGQKNPAVLLHCYDQETAKYVLHSFPPTKKDQKKSYKISGRIEEKVWKAKNEEWTKEVARKEQTAYSSYLAKKNTKVADHKASSGTTASADDHPQNARGSRAAEGKIAKLNADVERLQKALEKKNDKLAKAKEKHNDAVEEIKKRDKQLDDNKATIKSLRENSKRKSPLPAENAAAPRTRARINHEVKAQSSPPIASLSTASASASASTIASSMTSESLAAVIEAVKQTAEEMKQMRASMVTRSEIDAKLTEFSNKLTTNTSELINRPIPRTLSSPSANTNADLPLNTSTAFESNINFFRQMQSLLPPSLPSHIQSSTSFDRQPTVFDVRLAAAEAENRRMLLMAMYFSGMTPSFR